MDRNQIKSSIIILVICVGMIFASIYIIKSMENADTIDLEKIEAVKTMNETREEVTIDEKEELLEQYEDIKINANDFESAKDIQVEVPDAVKEVIYPSRLVKPIQEHKDKVVTNDLEYNIENLYNFNK